MNILYANRHMSADGSRIYFTIGGSHDMAGASASITVTYTGQSSNVITKSLSMQEASASSKRLTGYFFLDIHPSVDKNGKVSADDPYENLQLSVIELSVNDSNGITTVSLDDPITTPSSPSSPSGNNTDGPTINPYSPSLLDQYYNHDHFYFFRGVPDYTQSFIMGMSIEDAWFFPQVYDPPTLTESEFNELYTGTPTDSNGLVCSVTDDSGITTIRIIWANDNGKHVQSEDPHDVYLINGVRPAATPGYASNFGLKNINTSNYDNSRFLASATPSAHFNNDIATYLTQFRASNDGYDTWIVATTNSAIKHVAASGFCVTL